MNLPISWVVAGAIPASQALKKTADIAATSVSHFFGELLQTNPPPANSPPANRSTAVDNGRSAQFQQNQNPRASSEQKTWADRVESIRSYLSKLVTESRTRFGLPTHSPQSESISISANGKDQPVLSGPEPLRTELELQLQKRPALVKEINELALESAHSGPLGLLPRPDSAGNSIGPWKLWIDG